ncbi:MAG: hypothetical protein HOQ00_08525 [Agromyces sp.]|nr:hypothetical protein [Agromyces sp.]
MPTPRRRRAVRRGAAVVVATGLALALAGCVGAPAPTPTPTSAATPEPIFASDEEALAAAEAAYAKYNAASAIVTAEGGMNPARVDETVTSAYAETLHEEFAALAEAGLRMTGETKFYEAELAENAVDAEGARITIYLCRDVSAVRVVASDGSDVTPADRDASAPTQVFLVSDAENPTVLLVDGVDRWTGDDFC